MSVTFAVSPVGLATDPFRSIGPQRVLEALLGRAPEAWQVPSEPLVGHAYHHPLLQAAHLAFARHYPLTISPDAVWICLAQGFAQYLNANAEVLRNHAVRHQGKLTLSVRRDDFVKGSPDNPWSEVFSSFSE